MISTLYSIRMGEISHSMDSTHYLSMVHSSNETCLPLMTEKDAHDQGMIGMSQLPNLNLNIISITRSMTQTCQTGGLTKQGHPVKNQG